MTAKAKKALSLVSGLTIMVALVLTTVFCLISPQTVRKDPNSLPSDQIPSSDIVTGSLIKAGGEVNRDVLNKLICKVGYIESSDSVTTKDLGQINSGNPVTVKLFDAVTDTTNDIDKLTSKYWQVVYRTGNILTLWMVEPYTTAVFDNSNNVYENSSIRTLLNTTTYGTLNSIFSLDSNNFISTPAQLPVPWQTDGTKQLDETMSNSSYMSQNNLMDGELERDKLWLPSYAEIFNNTTEPWNLSYSDLNVRNGLWKSNFQDRIYFKAGSDFMTVMLRSSSAESNTHTCSIGYSYGEAT